MTGARDRLEGHEDRQEQAGTRRVAAPDHGPAIVGPADPRLAHAGGAEAGLLHLQRTAGNAAVSALVAPSVQRVVALDEVSADVTAAPEAGTPGGAASAGEAPVNPVTSDGASTTITGATITLDAAMTQTGGIIRAGTIIADSVVASSYTPGAGNAW
jgi:hypothetical protein